MTLTDNQLKFLSAAAILITWGGMVAIGKTDAAGFITALQSILVGLGVYHTALTNPKE